MINYPYALVFLAKKILYWVKNEYVGGMQNAVPTRYRAKCIES